jgi:hypothetical protein
MPAQPPTPMPQGKAPVNLAHTSVVQYQTVPMFWGGSAMLLIGVVIVAAFPARRPDPELVAVPKPSPTLREPETD